MVTHDELTQHLITIYQSQNKNEDLNIQTEKHYNYYGDRGVVDLVIKKPSNLKTEKDQLYVNEVKTHIETPNEVVRQANRMAEYFGKDNRNLVQFTKTRPRLVILANEQNYEKVHNYKDIFLNSQVQTLFCHPDKKEWLHSKIILKHKQEMDFDFYSFWVEKLGVDR